MMHEILFRGKSSESGEWQYGAFCHYDDVIDRGKDDCDYIIKKHNGEHFPFIKVDQKTVGQFTGLHDKNGTMIFDGDIVKLDDRLCAVTWFVKNAQWDLKFLRFYGDIRITNFKGVEMRELCEYEVIGNIHDNPELLKGGAE